MQMIDYESKTKTEDYVKQLVDSWPEGTRAIAYKYLHIAYDITLSNIDHEIDKAFTVKESSLPFKLK
jgi:hypothetical protein